MLAAREALASEPGSGDEAKADVGRSLTAIGRLLELTGKAEEAEAAYREAELRLAGPAGPVPSRCGSAALAYCRSRLGWLLKETGHPAEALSMLRLARADQEALAGAAAATDRTTNDLAATVNWLGHSAGRGGQGVGGRSGIPRGDLDPAKAGRRQPRRQRVP